MLGARPRIQRRRTKALPEDAHHHVGILDTSSFVILGGDGGRVVAGAGAVGGWGLAA